MHASILQFTFMHKYIHDKNKKKHRSDYHTIQSEDSLHLGEGKRVLIIKECTEDISGLGSVIFLDLGHGNMHVPFLLFIKLFTRKHFLNLSEKDCPILFFSLWWVSPKSYAIILQNLHSGWPYM